MLFKAIKELERELASAGYSVYYKEPEHSNSAFSSAYSVDLVCESYVGTVCFWPKSLFEFQFHDCTTGKVVVLESQEFHCSNALKTYVKELIHNRLASTRDTSPSA